MSESDKQEALLMAIEFLIIQNESLQNPCIALHISQYCLLNSNAFKGYPILKSMSIGALP
ncbi:MAG: hypothetical protein PHD43_14285 [Methylococcales bacterium]|nr:hypothetical protein [Methylococcales bacterium]